MTGQHDQSQLDRHCRPGLQAAIVGALALTVRLVYLWQIHGSLIASIPLGDAQSYDAWAQRLAGGDWIGHGVFYQAPLYPYLLGVIYSVGGHSLTLVRLVQAFMGAGACVLLTFAGRRFIGPAAGLTAGLMLALYAPAIFFDGLIQKTSLDTLLICLLLWTLARTLGRPDGRWFLALGLTLACLMLTRENALVLVACALAWAIAGPFPLQPRARAARAAWVLLGLALVLGPVIARNWVLGREFHLSTSQFGPNFYIGNNPDSQGVYGPLRLGRGAAKYEQRDATELAEQALGRKLSPGEVSSYWADQALSFIRGHPDQWLKLMGRKSLLVWNATEIADTEDQETYAESSPLLRGLERVMHFGLIFPLACAGAVLTWRRRRTIWVIHAIVLTYAASVVMFYVLARYRMPLAPPLLLLAAGGLMALPWSRRAALAAAIAGAAGGAVLSNWPLAGIDPASFQAITRNNLGLALAQMPGRLDEAIDQYDRAVRLDPDYAGGHYNLGVALMLKDRPSDAAEQFRLTAKLWPNFADAYQQWGRALEQEHKTDEAIARYRRAIELDPMEAVAHNNLGVALAQRGDLAQAAEQYQEALALDPAMASAHNNLGAALASQNKLAQAEEEFRKAVELEPNYLSALQNLAKVAAMLGDRQEAKNACKKILAISPEDDEAKTMLESMERAK